MLEVLEVVYCTKYMKAVFCVASLSMHFCDYIVLEVFALVAGSPNRQFIYFYYITTVLFHGHTYCTCSTLIRWRDGNRLEVWEAHKGAVQTVIKLSTSEIFTGKASAFFPFSHILFSWFLYMHVFCDGALLSCNLLTHINNCIFVISGIFSNSYYVIRYKCCNFGTIVMVPSRIVSYKHFILLKNILDALSRTSVLETHKIFFKKYWLI